MSGQVVFIVVGRELAIHVVQVLNVLDDEADIPGEPRLTRKGLTDRLKNARIPLSLIDWPIGPENETNPVGLLVPCADERVILLGQSL